MIEILLHFGSENMPCSPRASRQCMRLVWLQNYFEAWRSFWATAPMGSLYECLVHPW